ncbi:hypothetical protein JCM3765_003001 [Sporobolomyces pararoseus]
MVSLEESKATGTELFEKFIDPNLPNFAAQYVYLFALDIDALRMRFHAVDGNLDRLSRADQVSCRLVFISATERCQALDSKYSSNVQELLKSVQAVVDVSSIWRTPTFSNFVNLFLLSLLTKDDSSGYYHQAAASHFRHLFKVPSDLIGENGQPILIAYRFAVIDIQLALESGRAPQLSTRDHSAFSSQTFGDYSSLPDLSQDPDPSYLDICIWAVCHYLGTAQSLATHLSLRPAKLLTVEQDLKTITWAWGRLDHYERWVFKSAQHLRSASATPAIQALTLSVVMWIYDLCVALECYMTDHLYERSNILSTTSGLSQNFSTMTSLWAQSLLRYQGRICRLLSTLRSPDSSNKLGSAGFSPVDNRLETFVATFCSTSAQDATLFPLGSLDKLASVSFLLERFKSVQTSKPSPYLAQTISLLHETQAQLEEETGCPGHLALELLVSHPAQNEMQPNLSEAALLEAVSNIDGAPHDA